MTIDYRSKHIMHLYGNANDFLIYFLFKYVQFKLIFPSKTITVIKCKDVSVNLANQDTMSFISLCILPWTNF